MPFIVSSFYHFTKLDSLEPWREEFLEAFKRFSIHGTILLAPEGVNGSVSGTRENILAYQAWLRSQPVFAPILFKDSECLTDPFIKQNVKLKKEIVGLHRPDISPLTKFAKRISPEELSQWYKDKKEFLILDTRNSFEYALGTFDGAVDISTRSFHEFPARVEKLPEEWKNKPVVTFCTGGIRCEKAAPLMADMGFQEVYQLDGGILNYFEKVGGEHWHGECFVFDARVALTPDLKPTGTIICPGCQTLVRKEEKKDQLCPHCNSSLENAFGSAEAMAHEPH